jgi:hypothetical protein
LAKDNVAATELSQLSQSEKPRSTTVPVARFRGSASTARAFLGIEMPAFAPSRPSGIPSSMSRQLVGIVITVAAVGGCAHGAPKKAEAEVTNATATFGAWLGQLPRCPVSKLQPEAPSFRRDEALDAVEARGLLTLAAAPACTQMECGDSECCNTCFPNWVVMPDGGEGPRELAIQKSGAQHPLSAVMKDCTVGRLRQTLPPTRVVVSGFLEGGVIIRASMCVVDPAAAK